MRRTFVALLGLLLAGSANILTAQTPNRPAGPPPSGNGEVRGTVIDAKDTVPLARASVAVRTKKDNALIAGAMATPAGVFRVQGLRPGVYTLRITALGYSPKMQDVTITDAAPTVNLGAVRLSKFAVALKGVEVVEDRATVAIEPDRNTYRAKDVAPAAANASEVLDATPSVAVDQDGKVSLRGNENVAVQINGRPSPITGIQLGAYLKSLPANIIDRIEVVPNPSAKYDPEGMAGIINIVLKSTVDLGYSGGANVGVANAKRYNASGNVGYQAGPVTSFLNLGFNNDDRNVLGINDRERLDALRAPTVVHQSGHRHPHRQRRPEPHGESRLQAEHARRLLQRAHAQPSQIVGRDGERVRGADGRAVAARPVRPSQEYRRDGNVLRLRHGAQAHLRGAEARVVG